jgi:hypothetical protein
MLITILQKNDGTATTRINQSKKCWYLSTPFQEQQSAQKLDDSCRRGSSKNLQKYKF